MLRRSARVRKRPARFQDDSPPPPSSPKTNKQSTQPIESESQEIPSNQHTDPPVIDQTTKDATDPSYQQPNSSLQVDSPTYDVPVQDISASPLAHKSPPIPSPHTTATQQPLLEEEDRASLAAAAASHYLQTTGTLNEIIVLGIPSFSHMAILSEKLKTCIWADQYVDFTELLHPNSSQHNYENIDPLPLPIKKTQCRQMGRTDEIITTILFGQNLAEG